MDSVSRIASRFYGDRAADAANSIIRTERYKERHGAVCSKIKELHATFTEGQRALFGDYDDANNCAISLAFEAIYKAGLLDGIAIGSRR
jgi:hypothetical protein